MNTDSNIQNQTTEVEYHQEQNEDLQLNLQELRENQSLLKGFLAGITAAIIGAVIWALITVVTGYQIGWMAVGVGYLVGYAVRIAGKGIDTSFGITGALLALFGCLLGNIFTIYMFISKDYGVPVTSALLQVDLAAIIRILTKTFNPMDLLFYGIAIVEGWRFSTIPIQSETSED